MTTGPTKKSMEIAAEIQKWISCESPSNDVAALNAMAQVIKACAQSAALKINSFGLGAETGEALHITNRAAGDTNPGILVLSHYDTVHPIGSLRINPCRIEGNRLYGPGSYDMKAGLYLAMQALAENLADGYRQPVDLLIVPDEELLSPHSREFTESFAANARLCLVAEPARAVTGNCVTARKGVAQMRLHACGRAAHAGVAHHLGRNAIKELASQVLAVSAFTDYERGTTVNVGTISGGTTPNVVPASCEAYADIRIASFTAWHALKSSIDALKANDPDITLTVEARLNRGPMEKTGASQALLDKIKVHATAVGLQVDEAPITGGVSDGNFIAALGVPVVDALGADGDGAHTDWEHIHVDTLEARLLLWKRLLTQL
jgi:glutamate carboxypeptidase